MRGTHRGPVKSPHKWPVTQKMFPFDDVIMCMLHDDLIKWKDHAWWLASHMGRFLQSSAGLILGLHPANEKRRYKVTPSLIG